MSEHHQSAALRSLPTNQVRLVGGILEQRCTLNIQHLFLNINVEKLKQVYAETHDRWYAEPEFCGKYLDTAAQLYGTTGDATMLERSDELVQAIIAGQRSDGYLGTYHPGLEFDPTFSIWNEQFTIMGLLSYYEVTGDAAALECALRSADRLAKSYLSSDGPDLLYAINQGIQNTCLILQMARLYRMTGKQLYCDFCELVLSTWERSNLRLLSAPLKFEDPLQLIGCLKAAEMLICYQGLVEYHLATGNSEYLSAARGYWEAINQRHIGITGNGSICEYWVFGNPPVVSTDVLPNENCVAVCWMKLSAALLAVTGETRFADAFERTLYNHLLGSQARDGRDFSYYQGVEGRKIHITNPTWYSCCRYRGMNMLAHLPRYVVMQSQNGILINLYTASVCEAEVKGVPVTITQATDYPCTGMVRITVAPKRAARFTLALRVPEWCRSAEVNVNGNKWPTSPVGGFLNLEREWSEKGDQISLSLAMPARTVSTMVEERPVVACLYGPLVLALDTHFSGPIEGAEIEAPGKEIELQPMAMDDPLFPMVKFEAPGRCSGKRKRLVLIDYASAGSSHPKEDRFRVWIPVAGTLPPKTHR